jgi:hypothetical protein
VASFLSPAAASPYSRPMMLDLLFTLGQAGSAPMLEAQLAFKHN